MTNKKINTKSLTTNCKTSGRIVPKKTLEAISDVMNKDGDNLEQKFNSPVIKWKYCCWEFERADVVNKIFDHVMDEDGQLVAYRIRNVSDSIIPIMGIRYCPWCAEEAPKEKEVDDREA